MIDSQTMKQFFDWSFQTGHFKNTLYGYPPQKITCYAQDIVLSCIGEYFASISYRNERWLLFIFSQFTSFHNICELNSTIWIVLVTSSDFIVVFCIKLIPILVLWRICLSMKPRKKIHRAVTFALEIELSSMWCFFYIYCVMVKPFVYRDANGTWWQQLILL